jgi:RNA polymerase sigma-70 factor, ECF subfamily
LIPHLRAYSRSLARQPDADDLAQDAMIKAWKSRAHYQPGTNMKAWIFTILRNAFLSDKRRAWRTAPLDPVIAENTLVANDDPTWSEELLDVRNAMRLLPDDQREALILAGPAGLSYEETAKVCGCAIGTVKSRVSRARVALAAILESQSSGRRKTSDIPSSRAFDDIMAEAANLRRRVEVS